MVTAAYSRFVCRVWDQLEALTGHAPFYLDATHLASHCPACLDGTVRVGFVDRPEPGITIISKARGPGFCSHGCPETLIAEVLFG